MSISSSSLPAISTAATLPPPASEGTSIYSPLIEGVLKILSGDQIVPYDQRRAVASCMIKLLRTDSSLVSRRIGNQTIATQLNVFAVTFQSPLCPAEIIKTFAGFVEPHKDLIASLAVSNKPIADELIASANPDRFVR